MGPIGRFKVCHVAIFLLYCSTWSADCKILDCVGDPQLVYCPPWEEGVPTYHPYPYDCRKFIECTNGDAVVQCCPPGTVWDQDLLVCNHEGVTPCVIVTTPPPTPDSTATTEATTPPTTTTTLTTPSTTTTTPTTTTPTTTTPTTTTPTTTTPTTPTTTTPTTTTPTTTTPTTTTPTTLTTTTPTTTTPTTTTPTTTTEPTFTTEYPPIEVGMLFRLISFISPRAIEVENSATVRGTKLHATSVASNCSRLAQVWKLDRDATGYFFQSALGSQYLMDVCDPVPYKPCIWNVLDNNYQWVYSRIGEGSLYYTITQTGNGSNNDTIRYTGVPNDFGIALTMAPRNELDTSQWWEMRPC